MQIIRLAVFLLLSVCFAQAHVTRPLADPSDHAAEESLAIDRAVNNHTARRTGNDCEPLIIGPDPVTSIDTPEEFQNFTTLFATARIASTPLGYELVGQALSKRQRLRQGFPWR